MNDVLLVILLAMLGAASTTSPAIARVDYTLTVDSSDLPAIRVEMRMHGTPLVFQLAMATHPEYDDQYWRYVADIGGTSAAGAVRIERADSALWRVTGPGGDVVIRYQVRYPTAAAGQQAAWRAHLAPEGGLIGGPHSFLYVVGAEKAPSSVNLVLPPSWHVATGLAPGSAPGEFAAPDAWTLVDSPILVGRVRSWQFDINGVPHRISWLGHAHGVPFDSTLLVSNVERIARATEQMFGRMPYHRYDFLFEDESSGALEHLNSVSLGIRSADLARDPAAPLAQLAHEYFHTWNEVHLRPVSWIGVLHRSPEPTGELWWAEGVTLYYADLILRRAGLHTIDSTRLAHLDRLITTYFANPSHAALSLEEVSRGFNRPQDVYGDFTPSMYTQGEVVGAMLDLMIRQRTGGRRSLDDVMRALSIEHSATLGYTGVDIEHAVSGACRCDAKPFFDRYVRTANAVDFDGGLAALGWRAVVTWEPARDANGALLPDVRLSSFMLAGDSQPRLRVWSPATEWGRAGLHTGDRLLSWDEVPMADTDHLRAAIGRLRVGDTVRIAVMRPSGRFDVTVVVEGYDRPVVRVVDLTNVTATQRRLRASWTALR